MAKKNKLVFLISEISDGGAETLVKDYILNLDKTIFDISIITDMESDVCSANYQIIKEHKIKLFSPFLNIYPSNMVKKFFFFLFHATLPHIPTRWIKNYQSWYIRHKIQQLKPNVIHAHLAVLKYLPSSLKNLHGTKFFYTCHSVPYRYFNTSDQKEELEAARILLKNKSLTLIGLHWEMQNELNKLFNIDSTIIVHNSVDLERFYRVKTNNQKCLVREKNFIPKDAFVVGNVGRFIWIKNQSFIVDVFQEIIKRKPNSFLLLIGNGDSSEIARKLSSYGLDGRFLILSNRRDIPELLLCMDAFVFPSLFEGLPLACIEAQAMDLKCFISDSITKEVFLGRKAVPVSLSKSAKEWANIILDESAFGSLEGKIDDFDIKKTISQLTRLYCS